MVAGGTLDYEPVGLILLKGDMYRERTFLPLENPCDDFFCVYPDPYPDCKTASPPLSLSGFPRRMRALG